MYLKGTENREVLFNLLLGNQLPSRLTVVILRGKIILNTSAPNWEFVIPWSFGFSH